MARIDADPLNPRVYVQLCIDQLRRDVDDIRRRGACQSGDRQRLADAELELAVAEAELESIAGPRGPSE
jgi:hypothetical protein